MRTSYLQLIGAAAAIAAAAGCSGGGGLTLSPLQDQVVAVGDELSIVLVATSDAGGDVQYTFNASPPPSASSDLGNRATIGLRGDGSGVFTWRPTAADVGPWAFDFTATGPGGTDTETIQIDVRSAVGASSAPIFRNPLGTGTMLDLSVKECVELDVVVEDSDSTKVTIAQEAPIIEDATLDSSGDFTATWRWCPDRSRGLDSRYTLHLTADDGTNPKADKRYVVVLRDGTGEGCAGQPPVVSSDPTDESILVGLTVVAEVTDAEGLKEAPLFYYSLTPPSNPPNLGEMTQLGMLLLDGDQKHGFWGADVPNPVVSMPAGSQATVYYVVVATDNDDAAGTCDHSSESEVYSMRVTNPGGAGGLGLCEPCTADVQCGSSGGDLCVRVGTFGDSYCLKECFGESDCPAGYSCSGGPVSSVEGSSGNQCVPDVGTCGPAPAAACEDDSDEDNDTWRDAAEMSAGQFDAVSCPVDGVSDDDWYSFTLDETTRTSIAITGSLASDLDLGLFDGDGFLMTASTGPTADEGITQELSSGQYFVRVKAFTILGAEFLEENDYQLTLTFGPAGACTDDSGEPDDTLGMAREAPIWPDPYVSETNQICSGDDDWYRVELYDSETLTVDLTFSQGGPTENLDLHFYDSSGEDLTPCTEEDPSTCSSFAGQSLDSDEHYEFTAPSSGCPCSYYVVVHGFAGSENFYDLRIALQE